MSHLNGTQYDDDNSYEVLSEIERRIYARNDANRRQRQNQFDDLDGFSGTIIPMPNTPAEDELGESLRDCIIVPANSTPEATAALLYRQWKDTALWKEFKKIVWGLK